jgi:putative endonuclease
MKDYYIYIMSNNSKTIYIGMMNNLERRVYKHKHNVNQGFTSRYKIHKLVYFETTNDVNSAIRREKQLKNWRRQWKIDLIETMNPEWKDLFLDSDFRQN